MNIAIIGTGYVGLVTGACFASKGHEVICVDVIEDKINKINRGQSPIFEEGLDDMLSDLVPRNKLYATLNLKHAILKSDLIFICVGTPSKEEAKYDYTYLEQATKDVGLVLKDSDKYKVVVIKSTCTPRTTNDLLKPILERTSGKKCGKDFGLGFNPEFLREGVAVYDFLNPDRIVIGGIDKKSISMIEAVFKDFNAPILKVDTSTAEMIKIASNSFLAMKISFINEMANIAEKIGCDIKDIAKGIGMDSRISPKFLGAGLGWGGSCITGEDFMILGNSTPEAASSKELYDRFSSNNNVTAVSFNGENSSIGNVQHFTKREYNGRILTFKTKMGRKISVTEDHPMLVEKNGVLVTKIASDIKKGERLPILLDYPLKENKTINVYEVVKDKLDFLKFRPLKHNLSKLKYEIYSTLKDLDDPEWKRYEVSRINSFTLKQFNYLVNNNILPLQLEDYYIYTALGSTTYCPTIINLEADFWRLLGYYLAEGYINYEQQRNVRARIGLTFNVNEKEYIADVRSILKKLKIKNILSRKGNATTIHFSSRVFAYIIDNYLNCGTNSYNKRLPKMIFTETEEAKYNLLKGLFRGDAYPYFHKHANAITIEYGTVSKELAEGTIHLLHSLKIIPSYKEQMMKKSTTIAYILRINGGQQTKKLMFFDNKTNKKMNEILTKQRFITPMGYRKYKGFASLEIKDILEEIINTDVYSIEMESSPNTFVSTGGIIVHNCFPKDVSALHQLSKEIGVSSQMLESTIKVNKLQPLRSIELLEQAISDHQVKGKKIAILGLAFKPNTDDMREAVSIPIIHELLHKGAEVHAHDPAASENAKIIFDSPNFHLQEEPEQALSGAHGCIVVTEWRIYSKLSPRDFINKMKTPIVVDGRRMFNPEKMRSKGINYSGIGLGK